MGGTLLQKQGDEWVVIGYHSKRLPKSAKNFGVTELELTGLLANIHGFMQLLHNRYFEVLVDHKAIKYVIKSKTEFPTTRLKTLLLKLSEYTIELKYQKGSEMYTSDTLSRLHNFTDTPDQKDIIPLNFLQHFGPHDIEHSYSHLVKNLYAHKTKTLDATTVKRKCGRPPKPKPQIPTSKCRTLTAAKNLTTQPQQHTLIGIENLNSGYLMHRILDPKILAKYLEAVKDNLEETAPEFEPVFTNIYQYYGNSLISFTNTIDDLLLQLLILIKLKVQVPASSASKWHQSH